MSEEQFPDIATRRLLDEIGKHVPPPKEKTLFSLGGKGYYENPASDLLAFFLKPDGEHGFKDLFLKTFLECMEVDFADLGMADVAVSREEPTKEGNRIDLVVQCPDWVLLIENKVYHVLNNPLNSYEAYGRDLPGGKNLLMGILSPQGDSPPTNWKHVSYKDYCAKLRLRLLEEFFDHAYSKWVVFAREFILHFENELYQATMNDKQADYVEQHAEQIEQAKKLASGYRHFLEELLNGSLAAAIPNHAFTTKDDQWGIRCYARNKWRESHLAFLTYFSGNILKFNVRVYLDHPTPEQKEQADRDLQQACRMEVSQDGGWLVFNRTQPGFDKRIEAVNELCRLGVVLAKLFKSLPEPVQPLVPS